MRDTKSTTTVAWIFMGFYALYAIFGIGFNGLLFSIAIGLISYSMNNNIFIVAAATIMAGLAWKTLIKSRVVDTFKSMEGGVTKKDESFASYGGIMSPLSEGFSDIDGTAKKEDTTGESKPAEVGKETVSMEMVKSVPDSESKKEAIKSSLPTIGTQEKKVPDESKGGVHIDAAGTLLSALNQLKPDQVEKMTTETRALLETQKSLMGMLQTMKPLLSDGQEMMSTFQNMFGK